jgi:lysophospholipase L1-like esterase
LPWKKLALLLALLIVAATAFVGLRLYDEMQRARSDDPLAWAHAIDAFEARDADHPPPADATLFVGSSSIRLWNTLAEDMAPLVTIRRGFGGARMHDVIHYADRLITAYRPARVVIFVGSNDVNVSDTPMEAVALIERGLRSLAETIHAARADTQIYYIAITPTPFSWEKREAVRAANAAAERVCEEDPRRHFVATEDLFLTAEGEPDASLFRFDGLHLSAAGYARWTRRLKPLLLERASR